MHFRNKILTLEALPRWREEFRASGRRLAVTNGCFDLLHAGHVTCLDTARQLADGLLVGLNSDASVRELKGSERPLNNEADRALVLAALESVSAVCIFPEVRATAFLKLARPDVYVKGGDYTPDSLDPEERQVVEDCGGSIKIISVVPGRSTSGLLDRARGHRTQ